MSFFNELKRRNVIRVGVAYLVAFWLLLQVVDVLTPILKLPDWVPSLIFLGLLVGIVPVLLFSWAYEITPEGLKRDSEIDHSQSIASTTAKKLNTVTILLLLIVVSIVLLDRFIPKTGADKPTQVVESVQNSVIPEPASIEAKTQQVSAQKSLAADDSRQSVGVLPFVNMSDDPDNEYFSDGISEELLNVLVRIESLRVPSRTSSFTFKGSDKKLADIGHELGVDHILEGSVRKSNDRIRVTAQLIDVNTDSHLWSETYTRELDDVFAVQDEIAHAIVEALKLTLSTDDKQRIGNHSTTNVDAYNQYLLGRHLWNKRTAQDLLASTIPLLKAVELDSEYGQAWAALADAYVLIPEYMAGPINEFIPLAREATAKALSINPQSARALTTSAYIKFMYDYDHQGAREDFRKALELDPDYATAHQWYAEFLGVHGQVDAALVELELARRADPLSPIILHVMGWILSDSDRADESIKYYQLALELNPLMANSMGNLASYYLETGSFDLARQYSHELEAITGDSSSVILAIIDALENPEQAALKEKALELIAANTNEFDGVTGKAWHYMYLGESERALDSLEKAFAEGDPYAVHLKRLEVYKPLHNNPRYQALLSKMNMLP